MVNTRIWELTAHFPQIRAGDQENYAGSWGRWVVVKEKQEYLAYTRCLGWTVICPVDSWTILCPKHAMQHVMCMCHLCHVPHSMCNVPCHDIPILRSVTLSTIFQHSTASSWFSLCLLDTLVTWALEKCTRHVLLLGAQRDIRLPVVALREDFKTLVCKNIDVINQDQEVPFLDENNKFKKSDRDEKYLGHHKLLREVFTKLLYRCCNDQISEII